MSKLIRPGGRFVSTEAGVKRAPKPAPPLSTLGNRLALFLDLDGVLATIERHPDSVVPRQERTALLRALSERLGKRLAIISGRPVSQIDHICEGAVVSVAGVHGLQMRRPDGTRLAEHRTIPQQVIRRVLEFAGHYPSIYVENKSVAIAIHFRNEPVIQIEVRELALRLAAAHDLRVQSGHFVEELRLQGPDKGSALKAFMKLQPFEGSTPVMLGDDHTDEAAFEAAQSLGGIGIRIAPDGETSALYSLSDPDHVALWLMAYVAEGEWNE